ncbi:hypothetical protein HII30_00415 [Paenibacillus lemnae]|uniref:Uncharacterized protein n=2 Tax=Paenibacillus lemnae TaxID=1330551 RepID=A0A848M1Y7_PAELE|nr:hypothetical protein [Paenibacillus lemnae]
MMFISHWIIQHERKGAVHTKNESSHEEADKTAAQRFVNRMWEQRETVGGKLLLSVLVILGIMAIVDLGMALRILQPVLFVGMIVTSFIYIMNDEGEKVKEEELEPESHTMRVILRLIDYRRHPFSLGLLIFLIIVVTVLLSKELGFTFSLETGGHPRYTMSLPVAAFLLSGLTMACGWIYIRQHCDFFGLRQAEQGPYKLFHIHFFEIVLCGASFFIWLFVLVIELFLNGL